MSRCARTANNTGPNDCKQLFIEKSAQRNHRNPGEPPGALSGVLGFAERFLLISGAGKFAVGKKTP
jgi:hypothetical protein